MTQADGRLARDETARRAYELAQADDGARTDEANWLEAERELRAEQAVVPSPKRPRKRNVKAAPEIVPEAD